MLCMGWFGGLFSVVCGLCVVGFGFWVCVFDFRGLLSFYFTLVDALVWLIVFSGWVAYLWFGLDMYFGLDFGLGDFVILCGW